MLLPTNTKPFNWSISALHIYEGCPYHYKLRYVDKQPPPPAPVTDKEPANERGQRIHDVAKDIIEAAPTSCMPLTSELEKIGVALTALQRYAAANTVITEQKWGFDREWNPIEWQHAWGRAILDVFVPLSQTRGYIVDYKTGKYAYNEQKHFDQARLYAIACFFRYPKIETITAEFWYIDHGVLLKWIFGRDIAMRSRLEYETRVLKMESDTQCVAKPDAKFGCRYCAYKPVCEFAL